MLFAGAMTVATSVPATALEAVGDSPATSQRVGVDAAAQDDAQHLVGDGAMTAAVQRESYRALSAQDAAALNHIRRADTFTNDPLGTIQWPFPVGVPISDYFGSRAQPTAGASTFHEGVDFDPGMGTPIHVIADGVVRVVEPLDNSGYGVHVIVDHQIDGQLVSSAYGHMKPGSIRVSEGERVEVGQVLGLVGNTGVSTGAHLHFEIRLGGTDAVPPYEWMKEHAN